MIRIFILSENDEQAQALTALLAEESQVEVIGWETALNGLHDDFSVANSPDVILLNARVSPADLPFSGVPVIALSDDEAEQALGNWDHSGTVRAHLSTQAHPEEIMAAIHAVARGLTVLTPEQAEITFSTATTHQNDRGRELPDRLVEKLTPRELQVLRMVAEGLGNKEIAGKLSISDHTAKFHVASILSKLHAQTRTEAVALGIRFGLVPI